jgi:hypothetical protein
MGMPPQRYQLVSRFRKEQKLFRHTHTHPGTMNILTQSRKHIISILIPTGRLPISLSPSQPFLCFDCSFATSSLQCSSLSPIFTQNQIFLSTLITLNQAFIIMLLLKLSKKNRACKAAKIK